MEYLPTVKSGHNILTADGSLSHEVLTAMTTPPPTLTPADFEAFMTGIRPELHPYATRMTGSVIDGEDIVQEALLKANAAFPLLTSHVNLRGWMFRITHNKAIDHLRRARNEPLELLDEHPMPAESDLPLEEKELTGIALSVFLRLAPAREAVSSSKMCSAIP